MLSRIISGALEGVSAYLVCVEVDIASGLPGFNMVGSLSPEVRESRERVGVALKNAGIQMPPRRVTVNLSPADRKKEGTAYDLPIAVGILEAMEMIPPGAAENILFLGELGLDGGLKKARGVLPVVREAVNRGVSQCVVPRANAMEGAVIPGIRVRGAENILEVMGFLMEQGRGESETLPVFSVDAGNLFQVPGKEDLGREDQKEGGGLDFSQVAGQEQARRAAEIAAAGFHNLLMTGPPGAGKSMIAQRIPGILPPLTLEESLEVTSVVSVAGLMKEGEALVTKRPFCAPHHTISQAALIGGSLVPRPGMISLAHRGVLFLDELPEYKKSTLEILRQPMEDKQITLVRQSGIYRYPADFMLVAAMNPCPCGYFPDYNRCQCTPFQIQQYQGKISQPFLNRMDICVEVPGVRYEDLSGAVSEESSEAVRSRVEQARKRQIQRYRGKKLLFNAELTGVQLEEFCKLGRQEEQMMRQAFETLSLTARTYHKVLKVARTIADLDGEEQIGMEHLQEALIYRNVKV